MPRKFPLSHGILIGIVLSLTGYITIKSASASLELANLIVVVPVALLLLILSVIIPSKALMGKSETTDEAVSPDAGDVVLLTGFAIFCYALTIVGFDVASFIFVWGGVVLCGGKGLWKPPLFAALFTVFLVKGFGSLFPYPLETLVL